MRTTLFAVIALAAPAPAPVAATTPTATTPPPSIQQLAPDKPRCTQEKFRQLARKIYAQDKITKRDHERLYIARKCLKHRYKALKYQRQLSIKRQLRIDPWGYRWKQVDRGLKARLRRLLMCESTGDYRAVNGPYTGGYQYHRNTWARAGGTGEAMDASPREQDVRTAWFFPAHSGEWECTA